MQFGKNVTNVVKNFTIVVRCVELVLIIYLIQI